MDRLQSACKFVGSFTTVKEERVWGAKNGSTPLHLSCSLYVCYDSHLSIVKLLISSGADVSTLNNAASRRHSTRVIASASVQQQLLQLRREQTPLQAAEERLQKDRSDSDRENRSRIISYLKELNENSSVAAGNSSSNITDSTTAVADNDHPSAIDRLGPTVKADYEVAVKKGKLPIMRGNIDMLGEEDAGKTTLGDAFLDQPFIEKRGSTVGANVKVMRTGGGPNTNWKELKPKDKEEIIDQVLVRGFLESVESQQQIEATDETQDDNGEEAIGDTIQEAEQQPAGSTNTVALPTARQATSKEGNTTELRKPLRDLLFTKELTEEQAKLAEELRRDKAALEKSEKMMLITVCDCGGQEQFLMTHAALMADNSQHSATAYMIVMDGTKSLADHIPQCLFRPEQGREQLVMPRFGPTTRRELLAYHMNAIKMAHPVVGCGPFLGQDYVKQAPVTFAMSTREDKTKDMDPKFLEEQEEILQDIVQKNDFGVHMMLAEENPNKLTFRVDNTRTGTGSPDPVLVKVKEIFVAMVWSLWSQRDAIPLPWAVLDKLLSRVSQLDDNEGKILDLEEVCELARKFCDIMTRRECRSALQYLSSLSTIAFYSDVSELDKKVFTDRQWLVDVLNVFVTVLDKSNVPPELWKDLKKLKEEGMMSWSLAHHLLLQKGVKQSQFESILYLLHLFDVICPMITSLEMLKAVIKVGQSFFVPCLLEQRYDNKLAWQQLAGSTRFPPSLIFRPDGFDTTPEPIYFRLVSRCATEYAHPRPKLKRGHAVFHVDDDLELDLELVYHELHYIIATIYSPRQVFSCDELKHQCSIVRHFLIHQLNEAKKRGLDGFKFTVCINPPPTDAEDAKSIDDDSLVCIDQYPQQKGLMNLKKDRVLREQFPTLDIWFSDSMEFSDIKAALLSELDDKLSDDQLVKVARQVAHNWEEFVAVLSPTMFSVAQIGVIHDTYSKPFSRAHAALSQWADNMDKAATRRLVVSTFLEMGMRQQASRIFRDDLVEVISRGD
ncbi:uncharacterized protein LOC134182977 [Corticium candelabrum]|uniref:uncharacterized protein LOC134182977 n=1 Tax=Corticium candelabrum TaxID=121492 RepID=UPI002E2649A9|nr:uncharacterized protein LOC134182977 [Corticium candelabrum]